jgi:YVTN family beta-propeller protein
MAYEETQRIALGSVPFQCVFTSGSIWVTKYFANSVSRVDPVSNTILATVAVGEGPRDITVDEFGYIWVACFGYNNGGLFRIDPETNLYDESFLTTNGLEPRTVDFANGDIWVASQNNLIRVNPSTFVIDEPWPMGLGPDNDYTVHIADKVIGIDDSIWIIDSGTDEVLKVDPVSLEIYTTISLPVEGFVQDVPGVYDFGYLWVVAGSAIHKIDTYNNLLVDTIPITARSYSVDSDGTYLWITSDINDQLIRFEPYSSEIEIVSVADDDAPTYVIAENSSNIWYAASAASALVNISRTGVVDWGDSTSVAIAF